MDGNDDMCHVPVLASIWAMPMSTSIVDISPKQNNHLNKLSVTLDQSTCLNSRDICFKIKKLL